MAEVPVEALDTKAAAAEMMAALVETAQYLCVGTTRRNMSKMRRTT